MHTSQFPLFLPAYNSLSFLFHRNAVENNNQSVLSESVYDKNLFQSVSGISLFLFSILGHLSDEMEFIQFIECHQIKKLQHFLFWQKITPYIHHSPTMRETGSIRNADSRNPNLSFVFPVTIINGCRHELQQRLDTIKNPAAVSLEDIFILSEETSNV